MPNAALEPAIDNDSLHALAEAVLLQALTDLHASQDETRRSAMDWFAEEAPNGFSFEMCCRILQEEPAHVRRKLMLPCLSIAS